MITILISYFDRSEMKTCLQATVLLSNIIPFSHITNVANITVPSYNIYEVIFARLVASICIRRSQSLISYFDRSEMENSPPSHGVVTPFPLAASQRSETPSAPAYPAYGSRLIPRSLDHPPPAASCHDSSSSPLTAPAINPTESAAAPPRHHDPSASISSNPQLHQDGGVRIQGGPSQGEPPSEKSLPDLLHDLPPAYSPF